MEACNDQTHNMDRWLGKLEASNWLSHIKEILTTACLAAQCIDRCALSLGCVCQTGVTICAHCATSIQVISKITV